MGSVKDKYLADLQFHFPTRTFAEVTNGSLTDLEMHEATHTIDSVSDSGGTARFVVTGGPTLAVGDEVTMSGFTGSAVPYNTTGIISAIVSGDFEIAAIDFIESQTTGSFILLVDRVTRPVVDDAYKRIREERVGFAADDSKATNIASVQTTDASATTIATLAITDETTNIIHADIIGIKSDGTDRAVWELTVGIYRTGAGSAALVGTTSTDYSGESDASWGTPTLTASGNNLLVQVTGKAATTIDWVSETVIETFVV